MPTDIILASGSKIRSDLLTGAGVRHRIENARIDEQSIRAALVADGIKPRDIADALAEAKARKVSLRHENAVVIGCDQILDRAGTIFAKPATVEMAIAQLRQLSGQQHHLYSAAVVFANGQALWRHVGKVSLLMRPLSNGYLVDYAQRNWQSIRHSVGCYKLEEEGVRLFSKVEGDYFTVLGLPLVQVLNYLTERGELPG